MLKKCVVGVITSLFIFRCFNYAYCAEMLSGSLDEDGRVLTISDGIDMVSKDSRLIKIELADKDISFEDTINALSPLLPHITMNAAKTYYRFTPEMKFNGIVVPMGEREPLSWGIDIYQTLFDFGKSISNYQASTEAFHARIAKVKTVKRTVILEFIVAYFDLLESEKMISVAEKEVDSLTSYLNDSHHLYEQGVIVKNDLLPAQVKLADARQKLIAAHNRKEVVAAKLKTMLTLSLKEKIEPHDVSMEYPPAPTAEDAWKAAESQRPEIVFYNDQIKASQLSERAKSLENLPSIYVDGGYAYTENRYMVKEANGYIQMGAKINLYDGGASTADMMRDCYQTKQLGEEKNKLIDDIRYEVEYGLLDLRDASEKLSVSKEALTQSEENVRFYRVKYNNGAATSTDVLEAITLQTKAETNYYSADYELKRSYAKLMYSIGNDLTTIYKEMEK